MGDERLREFERRWRESGSVEDEAAYLRERVRVGELSQERLELAASLHYEPALRAADKRASLAAALDSWNEEACVRGSVAAVQALLPRWDAIHTTPEFARYEWFVQIPREILTAAEIFVVSGVCKRRVIVVCGPANGEAAALSSPIGKLAEAVAAELPGFPRSRRQCALDSVQDALNSPAASDVQESLRAELAPWALGYYDPVRDRVEARQRAQDGE